ncbi:MAG: VWA domain-containing protein [Oceanospirillaceae bacterium]|nr:VWA domain-containing protein [Oceanospirillaceae bacterium]
MKKLLTLKNLFAAITLTMLLPSVLQANELGNPGFENDTSGSYGDNIAPQLNVAPWVSLSLDNVVQVDGVGGQTTYGNRGPESDASGILGVRHYLDMQGDGEIYQSFTTPNDCSGEVRFGGSFSTRHNEVGKAHIEIREGVGNTGALVGTTTNLSLPVGNSETDPWVRANYTAFLTASTTYSFVIVMDNYINFDEGYVNFLSGPCQDDTVIDPPPPPESVCLEIKHEVSCTSKGWSVSLTHDPSSLLQPDHYNLSPITSGVTISGSSPNYILNGALPNTAVDLLVFGTQKGKGNLLGTDRCCEESRIHVDIPNQACPITCDSGEELVNGVCQVIEEPDISPSCNSNIVIVVDESGSIADNPGDPNRVRLEVRNLLKGFKGHGSKASVIHFDTNARLINSMLEIATAPGQEIGFSGGYTPSTGQTNWEAGLSLALAEINSNPGPELVFFITDGQPNRYLDNNGAVQTGSEATSVNEAVVIANQIKAAGARIFSIGVGNIANSSTAAANLQAIASSGDAITGSMNDLAGIVADYTAKSCADIHLQKYTVADKRIDLTYKELSDAKPTFDIAITNNTPGTLTGIVVEDALPTPQLTFNSIVSTSAGTATQLANVLTWVLPPMAANTTEYLRFKTNISGVDVGEQVYNYTQVVAVDQTIASNVLLANPTVGPLNPNDRDEARDYVYVVKSSPCMATVERPEGCLGINKVLTPGEGNCESGQACEYTLWINNNSSVPYAGGFLIGDNYTPSGSAPIDSIQASGGAPANICDTQPTSIPFSCTQSTDIPAYTRWKYVVTTTWATDATKNCFTVNSRKVCVANSSGNKSSAKEPKQQLLLSKYGPKRCTAGGVCHFTIEMKNASDKAIEQPITIVDKPNKMFGRVQGASNGWKCQRGSRSYQCVNPTLELAANASTKFALSLSVPKNMSGKVTNCVRGQGASDRSDSIMLLQTLLLKAGHDPRGVDGQLGPGTRKAMAAYAKANGLKSQDAKTLLQHLQQDVPELLSNTACTTVRIDRPKRQCKSGTEYQGGVCVSIKVQGCPAGSNWTGKQCVTCEEGSLWNQEDKACEFPVAEVKCQKGEKREGNQCIKVKKPRCIPIITRYSEMLGMCVPNISIGIGIGGPSSPTKDDDHP